jgi:peptidyl-prolyl cis-trans isomerase C
MVRPRFQSALTVWQHAALAALLLAAAACSGPGPTAAPDATAAAATPAVPLPGATTATPTAPPPGGPTTTPVPLAATVNGEPISLAAWEREVARCQSGLAGAGFDATVCPRSALQDLIDSAVQEQAARRAGLSVSAAEVDAALAEVEASLGGPDALAEWRQANLYTPDEFRAALQAERLRVLAGQQVVAGVGPLAEQVHARAIVVTSPDTAGQILAQLQAGADFSTLAVNFSRDLASRVAGGDLGWFPRGVLSVPEVEQAAFALQPGELSGVIASDMGYHIVQTLERDPARPLDPAAADVLRKAAWQAWLDGLLAEASISLHVNP